MVVEKVPNFWGETPAQEYYESQGVKNQKELFETPQGRLFTQSWLPLNEKPKGVVCLTHGYTSDTGWTFQIITIAVAQMGYAAYAADMPGHGRSYGLPGYVPNFDSAAASLLHFYKSVRDRKEYEGLPHFLFGESMGGMMTLLMHFQDPKGWDGIILSAPLISVGHSMTVPWSTLMAFKIISPLMGTWQIPTAKTNVTVNVIRDPVKAKLIFSNPRRYVGATRVKTRLEVERVSAYFIQNLANVSVPFLVLHGKEDNMTDPLASQKLYEVAGSRDKTLRLYEGAYHSLIQGELDETRAHVLRDIRSWLDLRSSTKGGVELCMSSSIVDPSVGPVLSS
ncbi:hypothetical protein R1flu_018453 [Riccia fluitans]|uniref:Serine aminopeptidase S33 domain-containing protein n=1 Tax=Riccia fluitans TaxID=41844 RepID=A0ABD1ZFV9_9MARC